MNKTKKSKKEIVEQKRYVLKAEYYIERAKELLRDPLHIHLLYLIGTENGLSNITVKKDKNKKYFKDYIITYLSNEIY